MPSKTNFLEISCQQVMVEDASVFSLQRADLPAAIAGALSAEELLRRYLFYIRKCTLTLIRPVTLESGIEFRLAGTGRSLISFLPPICDKSSLTLRICGGFLVQPRQCDRGELRFGAETAAENVRVSLQLSDFCPLILGGGSPSRLRFWLYRFTQATIHRLVTVRFLTLLYRELAGPYGRVRVKNIAVHAGKPV
ncbi:MAG: hypothetical protein PHR66_03225 [Desulfuromonadaceae bacterium]|nr:hypothetical protein [Desulfuromonadaceae bacterium]